MIQELTITANKIAIKEFSLQFSKDLSVVFSESAIRLALAIKRNLETTYLHRQEVHPLLNLKKVHK